MTKNSEIYGNKTYLDIFNSRTVERTDSIVESIIDEHIQRAKKGKEKYGKTLDRTDLSVIDYLQHTKEELMDAVLYIEKTIQMLNGKVEKSNE